MYIQVKVHRYWPAKQPANIGTLVVEMTNEMVYDDYTMREIKLTNTKVSLKLPCYSYYFSNLLFSESHRILRALLS